jgi:colanic acid biosynthesis glycosyl transferase WcaI
VERALRGRRFLILTQYFPPEVGAPQTRLAAMASELVRLGNEVEVVTALPNYPTGHIFPEYRGRLAVDDRVDGISVRRTWLVPGMGGGFRRLLNYASFSATSLLGLVRSRRPDIVFVESPPLTLAMPGILAAKVWRAPVVLNVADLWPDSPHDLGMLGDGALLGLGRRLEAWAYRHSAAITTVTEGIRERLIVDKRVPASKIFLLPNGVNVELFHPEKRDTTELRSLGVQVRPQSKIVMYAGTMGLAQGLEVALNALKLASARDPHLHLVLVGDGTTRTFLEARARQMGLRTAWFIPPQSLERLARLWAGADVGFASLRGLPLFAAARPSKLLPMMAAAKPVVYSGAGEAAALIKGAQAGIAVPPDDPAALAEALLRLSSDDELSRRLGSNGRHFVEQNFTWKKLVGDWLEELDTRMVA